MGTIQDKLNYLNTTKGLIKQAIIDKGQTIADTDTFRSYTNKISAINSGNLNVFIQQTEPENKNGIWIKRDPVTISDVVASTDISVKGEWSQDGIVASPPNNGAYGCISEKVNDCIYLLGNGSSAYNKQILKYDTLLNSWQTMNSTSPIPINSPGENNIISVGNYIYAFGYYYDRSNYGDDIVKYNTVTDVWETLGTFPFSPSKSLVTKLETDIYLLNGELYKYNTLDDSKRLSFISIVQKKNKKRF